MIFLFSTGNLVLPRLDKIVCQVLKKHMIFGFLKFMCFIGTKHLCASCLQNTRVLTRQTHKKTNYIVRQETARQIY